MSGGSDSHKNWASIRAEKRHHYVEKSTLVPPLRGDRGGNFGKGGRGEHVNMDSGNDTVSGNSNYKPPIMEISPPANQKPR